MQSCHRNMSAVVDIVITFACMHSSEAVGDEACITYRVEGAGAVLSARLRHACWGAHVSMHGGLLCQQGEAAHIAA